MDRHFCCTLETFLELCTRHFYELQCSCSETCVFPIFVLFGFYCMRLNLCVCSPHVACTVPMAPAYAQQEVRSLLELYTRDYYGLQCVSYFYVFWFFIVCYSYVCSLPMQHALCQWLPPERLSKCPMSARQSIKKFLCSRRVCGSAMVIYIVCVVQQFRVSAVCARPCVANSISLC